MQGIAAKSATLGMAGSFQSSICTITMQQQITTLVSLKSIGNIIMQDGTMNNDNFDYALEKVKLLANSLYAGSYTSKSDRNMQLAHALTAVHKFMKEEYLSFMRGDTVVVIEGLVSGSKAVVEFVEPSGEKIWVLPHGSVVPVFYRSSAIQKIDPKV